MNVDGFIIGRRCCCCLRTFPSPMRGGGIVFEVLRGRDYLMDYIGVIIFTAPSNTR